MYDTELLYNRDPVLRCANPKNERTPIVDTATGVVAYYNHFGVLGDYSKFKRCSAVNLDGKCPFFDTEALVVLPRDTKLRKHRRAVDCAPSGSAPRHRMYHGKMARALVSVRRFFRFWDRHIGIGV